MRSLDDDGQNALADLKVLTIQARVRFENYVILLRGFEVHSVDFLRDQLAVLKRVIDLKVPLVEKQGLLEVSLHDLSPVNYYALDTEPGLDMTPEREKEFLFSIGQEIYHLENYINERERLEKVLLSSGCKTVELSL